eukprot:TRINITY_DN15725_c0_g1_i1.p1 TRINITY_DN15725_c0_g1~~TRINITY_DN15725_c0_g1_i1.p1  ORF type:complete len:179 (+),score=41.91 TRINITY_DN15725_c0_g1_i1:32-568(+)
MFDKLKTLGLAAIIAVAAPIAASAATLSGSLGIAGNIDGVESDIEAGGDVVFVNGFVLNSSGDFSSLSLGQTVTLTDIDFDVVGTTVWAVDGFEFSVSSYADFLDDGTYLGFTAYGVISKDGFDDTDGMMVFTTQDEGKANVTFSATTTTVPVPAAGLMLITGLGGLAAVRRRRKAAA